MDTVDVTRDLSGFTKDTPWDDRLATIRRTFPSALPTFDWRKAFDRDIDLAGRILRDILKADQAVPGRPGPRPALDPARAEPTLDRWEGRDPTARPYTLLPFPEALALLADGRSLSTLAHKIGLPRSQVHRLLRGEIVPSGQMMETIADAFGKNASYFLEYRIGTIAAALVHRLTAVPDQSVRSYEALFWQAPA